MNNQQGGAERRSSVLLAGVIILLFAINILIIFQIPRKAPRTTDTASKESTMQTAVPPQSCPVPPHAVVSDTTGTLPHPDDTMAQKNMRRIPGGSFMMGTPDSTGDGNEHPFHPVNLSAFMLDSTEVTQKEYLRVMGKNPSYFKDCPDCPVENVTWNDAVAYCRMVGKRLPTEAEWEYAARGGNASLYFWGNTMNSDYTWYSDNAAEKTHPVGQKKPNGYGLYDMLGNVWEWCSDWYDSTYYTVSPVQNPQGPATTRHRVFRGGSWLSNETSLHCAHRDGGVPESRGNLFGFRCAKSID